jgi:hypothetical protein
VRKNSEKQSAASVTNGNKSLGPTSPEGKEQSKLNALKNGLFSRDIVVAAAGEVVEDFELLKEAVFGSVQPGDAVDVMLAEDLVENWWRRQRVRRSQTAELNSRLENLKMHQRFLLSDEIEALKLRFVLLVERCQVTNCSTPDPNEIAIELEKARSELAATSLGLEFLIEKVEAVKLEVESRGQMSDASLGLLRACIGLTHDFTLFLTEVNRFNKTESAKATAGESERPLGSAGPSDEVEPDKGQRNRNRRKKKTPNGVWRKAKLC